MRRRPLARCRSRPWIIPDISSGSLPAPYKSVSALLWSCVCVSLKLVVQYIGTGYEDPSRPVFPNLLVFRCLAFLLYR